MRLATFMAIAYQPRLLQDPKMLGDGRLRDPGPSRQSPDRLLSFAAQSLEKSPPSRIGERAEEHIVSVRHWIDNPLAIDWRITAEICVSQAGMGSGIMILVTGASGRVGPSVSAVVDTLCHFVNPRIS